MNRIFLLLFISVCICGCSVNPSERNNAGNALYNQGQYDSAIAAYQAAQVASPDSPEAYYNVASAYSRNGEFDKAIDALHQALKTTDAGLRTQAYYNLANVYFQMEQFDDAVEAYQQALLLNPNDDDARHNLELAIKRLVIPSPTPISPTDQPTDEGNNGATPTADSSSQTTPVVTNSADQSTAQPTNSSPNSSASELPPTVSVDDAKSILDAVQQAQQSLSNQQLSGTPASVNTGKDW